MKKLTALLLTLTAVLSLAACGGRQGDFDEKAPDLNQYYEDFMSTLGADNTPAMMDLEGEFLETFYPGLSGFKTKQLVVKAAAISSVLRPTWRPPMARGLTSMSSGTRSRLRFSVAKR